MDVKKVRLRMGRLLEKYKYAAAVLLVGLVLMLLPTGTQKESASGQETPLAAEKTVQQELEELLMQVQGAGKVRVLLREATGAETLYQLDEDRVVSDSTTTEKKQSVTVTDENRTESGLIRQVNPPTYSGAIVLCQGADDPAVKLAIADAVSKITGLGMNKIAVLKME